jgi:hypothetical protein
MCTYNKVGVPETKLHVKTQLDVNGIIEFVGIGQKPACYPTSWFCDMCQRNFRVSSILSYRGCCVEVRQ